jgi:hypothetical protein
MREVNAIILDGGACNKSIFERYSEDTIIARM